MASRLAWFLTPMGRKCSFGFMTAASVVTFTVQYVPHTFLLYKYKEIVSMYQAAVPVPLHERLVKRWNDTLADLTLSEHHKRYLEPFTVFGFDIFQAGTTATRNGAIVGLPINFTYQDPSTIDPSGILINHETVNWNREDAKKLLDALVLSENAQRYGIAREIMMSKHNAPLIFSTIGSFMVSSTYVICRLVNEKFKLYERPLSVRGVFYLLGGLFGLGMWAAQIDLYNNYRENDTDIHLSQLGENYIKGAIEFYDKMLKRNIALRSLMGTQGEGYYTPTGNERFIFRQPRIPIDQRKRFFESHLTELKRHSELLVEDEVVPQVA